MMTLNELLEKQKILTSKMNYIREPKIEDIILAITEELLEVSRALGKESYKVWKEVKTTETAKQEVVDIWFFFLQYINLPIFEDSRDELYEMFDNYKIEKNNIKVKSTVICCIIHQFLFNVYNLQTPKDTIKDDLIMLLNFSSCFFESKEELIQLYLEKWEKNMKRIGSEWR